MKKWIVLYLACIVLLVFVACSMSSPDRGPVSNDNEPSINSNESDVIDPYVDPYWASYGFSYMAFPYLRDLQGILDTVSTSAEPLLKLTVQIRNIEVKNDSVILSSVKAVRNEKWEAKSDEPMFFADENVKKEYVLDPDTWLILDNMSGGTLLNCRDEEAVRTYLQYGIDTEDPNESAHYVFYCLGDEVICVFEGMRP